MAIGDTALSEAISFYTKWIFDISTTGEKLSNDEWQQPLFTYIMTKKQFNRLNVLCQQNGWPRQTCSGIIFSARDIQHVITARTGKDSLTWQEVADILNASYCVRSVVAVNKGRNKQAVVLNSVTNIHVRGQKYYGLAIIQVSENNLAPVTAYHATKAKIEAILK
jgi:hypothetical protein